ncbi:ankyrin repeat domain-containing protein [Crenobacter sp. SG2303]|uniref:Ankyrin repeat domain-containing protein n=1 Tax=Crenobacter oryzisoli TaxID=3056844 RepID=A0ABT7XUW2_9NEIS|nr:ankyrin repeat domain-containing protein [Crenobacter sp. SG2303]MDN0077596.1 ankyrin repeat domain-containing protein [Crenobacter sp. SG2303]
MTAKNKSDRRHALALPRNQTGQLHQAAAAGQVDLVRLYVKYGDDINSTDQSGMTPLHVAYQNGCLSVVEALIALNADQTIKDHGDNCAYDLIKEGSFVCSLRTHERS